jgi:hypothetical protein
MANFDRLFHWETFAPNIGDNRALLSDQLTLELAVGLTKTELRRFQKGPNVLRDLKFEAIAGSPGVEEIEAGVWDKVADLLAVEWGQFVRLGPGSHSMNGKPIAALRDYLRFVLEQPGAYNVMEIVREVQRLNAVEGTRALFSAPPAGVTTSTSTAADGRGGSQTGGR